MHTLLRVSFSCWVVLLLLLAGARPAWATHLLGGELTYRYLDANGPAAAPLRYELTLTVYNDCSPSSITPATAAEIAIYTQPSGQRLVMTTANYATLLNGNINVPTQPLGPCVSPVLPGCTIVGPVQPYRVQQFIAVVNLPTTTTGFYAVYTQNARNAGILNLTNSSLQNMTLATLIAPPALLNRSPVFANIAVAVLCASDTTFYLNNVVDADGDRLEYTFGRPYGGTGLPASPLTLPLAGVPYYNSTYSATTPFGTGAGIVSQLDAATGIATLATPTTGRYAVAVDVKEYRTINGVEQLIGTTRRDIQLLVATCPQIPKPKLDAPTLLPRSYTVVAGSPLTVPLAAAQNQGHPLTMTVSSELLDGSGGSNATFGGQAGTVNGPVGTAVTTGTGNVAGNFDYTPSCAAIRDTPYDLGVLVQDNSCAGKTVADIFRITVVAPTGPTAIAGSAVVCSGSTGSYSASGSNVAGVTWTVTGGTIVGSPTANPVQVQWGAAGTGTLTAQSPVPTGCPALSLAKTITITALPSANVGVSPRTTASGVPLALGATAVAGNTYRWSPATGLSSATVANPTLTLTNTTGAPLTQVYTLTETTPAGCQAANTVSVTVAAVAATKSSVAPGFSAQVAPVPFGERLTVSLTTLVAGPLQLTLHDGLGRVVRQTTITVPAGTSSLALPQAGTLPAGSYLLTVRQGGNTQVIRVAHE